MSQADRPANASFYEDTIRACGLYWSKEWTIRHRLEALGWKPKPHDLRRMLKLLHKHGRIDIRTSSPRGHLSARIRIDVSNLKKP